MTGLQGRTAVVAGLQPSPHRHMLLGVEQLFAESGGILHEVVCGADTECTVVIFDVHLSEIDHHVFVQVSLASQIAAKEVKGKGEQILGVSWGPPSLLLQVPSHAVLPSLERRKMTLSAAAF